MTRFIVESWIKLGNGRKGERNGAQASFPSKSDAETYIKELAWASDLVILEAREVVQ